MRGNLNTVTALSARRLTAYYITALLIIGGLTIASHFALTYVLQHNQGAAAIINISGRQRMLSQRIAGLAAEYRLGDQTARPELLAAIVEFKTVEDELGAVAFSSNANDAETVSIRNIYANGVQSLNVQVAGFVADAQAVASLPPNDPAAADALARVFAAARSPLLVALNNVVTIHQRGAEAVLAELKNLQVMILAVVLLTLAIEALTIFRPMIRWIVVYTSEIVRLATIDPLTGVSNRRGFLDRCEAERIRAERHGRPLCLLMLDADNFKAVNDTYGHDGGDAVLRAMAECFRRIIRTSDFVGRLGGEEFAVLLIETDLPGAMLMAERLREAVEGMAVDFEGHRIAITVSIGVASVQHDTAAIDGALRDADALMYRAKRGGRNCVVSVHPALVG